MKRAAWKAPRSALLIAALLIAPPAPAADVEQEAAARFERGAAAYRERDFLRAALAFEEAHRLLPRAATAYSAGLAWEAGGEPARAADMLAEALALEGLQPNERRDARERLDALRQSLARLVLRGPRGMRVSFAHHQRAALPLEAHLRPGRVTLAILSASGRETTRTEELLSGELRTLDLTPPPAPREAARPEEGETPVALWIGGGVSLGIAATCGAVAVGLGVATLQARDDYAAGGFTDTDRRDEAATYRTATNVLWAAAGAAAVAGVVMIAVGWSGGEDDTLSIDSKGVAFRF